MSNPYKHTNPKDSPLYFISRYKGVIKDFFAMVTPFAKLVDLKNEQQLDVYIMLLGFCLAWQLVLDWVWAAMCCPNSPLGCHHLINISQYHHFDMYLSNHFSFSFVHYSLNLFCAPHRQPTDTSHVLAKLHVT